MTRSLLPCAFLLCVIGGCGGSGGDTFKVSGYGDNLTVSPKTATVKTGGVASFTLKAKDNYTLRNTPGSQGGTCATGKWSGDTYTTGAIIADCDVLFYSKLQTRMVNGYATHATVSPTGAQEVPYGSTVAFTVVSDVHYRTADSVTTSCPAGTWGGQKYTTGAITEDCSVQFSAALDTVTVTPSGTHVTIDPAAPTQVTYGTTQSFTVTPDTTYATDMAVGGDCPTGTWNGAVYTTAAITLGCAVTFSASL